MLQALQDGLEQPLPPHFEVVLTCAHFLNHMYATRPSKQIEASPWYEGAIEMVRQELRGTYRGAQKVRPRRDRLPDKPRPQLWGNSGWLGGRN